MRSPQNLGVEHYKDQKLEFKIQSLSRCIYNPFEKTHEAYSRVPSGRYSMDAITKSHLYQRSELRRSQGKMISALDLDVLTTTKEMASQVGNRAEAKSQILPRMSPGDWTQPGAVTELENCPEGVRMRNREILRTESKMQGSRVYLPSPYKIPPSTDSFPISFKNTNFLAKRIKPLQSVESFERLGDAMSTEAAGRVDFSQYPRRVVYNNQIFDQVKKPAPKISEFFVVNFSGLVLQLLYIVFVTLFLMMIFNFVFLCRSIKNQVFEFYWTNSFENIRLLLVKALWGSVTWQNLGIFLVLAVLAAVQRYFQRQKEYVEEAEIVYIDLESVLMAKKIEDKTFFDENFSKKAFFHRGKIAKIRRYLNHMINADGRIRVLKSRSNLEIFVFSV